MLVGLGMFGFLFLSVCCTWSSLEPGVNNGLLFVVVRGIFLTLQCDPCVSEYLQLLQHHRSGCNSLPAVGEWVSLPSCGMEERSMQKGPVSQNWYLNPGLHPKMGVLVGLVLTFAVEIIAHIF